MKKIIYILAAAAIALAACGKDYDTKKEEGGIDASFFQSLSGHVVIRVSPSGARYWIFVLDDSNQDYVIKSKFGPYAPQ